LNEYIYKIPSPKDGICFMVVFPPYLSRVFMNTNKGLLVRGAISCDTVRGQQLGVLVELRQRRHSVLQGVLHQMMKDTGQHPWVVGITVARRVSDETEGRHACCKRNSVVVIYKAHLCDVLLSYRIFYKISILEL